MTQQPGTVLVNWVVGDCWKCDGRGLVTWVGPAQCAGQHAPIYLCQSCLVAVERRTLQHFMDHYPDAPAAAVAARPYFFPPLPERPPMPNSAQPLAPPAQITTLTVTALGIRARADGRTGWEAWRIIRRRHPRVAWAAGAYTLLLAGLAATALARLVTCPPMPPPQAGCGDAIALWFSLATALVAGAPVWAGTAPATVRTGGGRGAHPPPRRQSKKPPTPRLKAEG
ncbi:hypothetical protein [Streptomyces murinus]